MCLVFGAEQDSVLGSTSIRRFEQVGDVADTLKWMQNHDSASAIYHTPMSALQLYIQNASIANIKHFLLTDQLYETEPLNSVREESHATYF